MAERPVGSAETTVRAVGARQLTIRQVRVCSTTVRVGVWSGTADQPPLLLFNGIGAGLELLAPFADAMGDVTVVAFDVPGAGESALPAAPYRLWMLANLVDRLLDALGYGRVDVLGVSWGGAAAQQFAVQNPRRCRRLVLAATSTGTVMVPPSPTVLAKFVTPRRFNDRQYLRTVAGEIYGGKAATAAATGVLEHFRGTSRRGYLYQQLALAGWTSVPWLRLVRQQTLVLGGDDDRVVTLANAWILDRLLPNSRLRILRDGHLFMITSADETAAYVAPFLAGGEPPVHSDAAPRGRRRATTKEQR